jgi:hypothetical protein
LKRKLGWTDSFLKALHSTCHLFFPHYLAIRNNLECLPYTKQTPYITASRHVTFVHFVLFLRVLPCCPQKGWARAKLRMITQQIVPRDTLPSHHISAQSCRKAVSIDGSCLCNRKAVFCTLEPEIQVRQKPVCKLWNGNLKQIWEQWRSRNASKKKEPQTQLNRFVSQSFPSKREGRELNLECFLEFQNAFCTEQTFCHQNFKCQLRRKLGKNWRTNLAMPCEYKQESKPQVLTQSSLGKHRKLLYFIGGRPELANGSTGNNRLPQANYPMGFMHIWLHILSLPDWLRLQTTQG